MGGYNKRILDSGKTQQNKINLTGWVFNLCVIRNQKYGEDYEWSSPPFFTTTPTHPQFNSNPNFFTHTYTYTLCLYISPYIYLYLYTYIHNRSVLLYFYLPLSFSFSLFSLSYASREGFDFFFFTAIGGLSILALFVR